MRIAQPPGLFAALVCLAAIDGCGSHDRGGDAGPADAASGSPQQGKEAYAAASQLDRKRPKADAAAVLAAYQSACDLGSAAGCLRAGDLNMTPPAKDPEKALNDYDHGCRLDDVMSCVRAALRAESTDKKAAAGFDERACSLGNVTGCVSGISLYLAKDSPVHDPQKALTTAQGVCEKESSYCDVGADILLTEKDIPHDEQKALSLYQRACDSKNPAACTIVGLLLDGGRGGSQNPSSAFAAYQKGCALHHTMACTNAAFDQLTGYGTAADASAAIPSLTELCERSKDEMGCYDLGLATIAGRGEAKDEAKGHAFLEHGGNRYPEVHLGHDYALGLHGIKVDLQKAEQHMDNACQGGYEHACDDRDALKSAKPGAHVKLASTPEDEPMRWCLQGESLSPVNCHSDHGVAPKNGKQTFHTRP